jgi:hypothetical protein
LTSYSLPHFDFFRLCFFNGFTGIEHDFEPLYNAKLVFPSRSETIQGALVFSEVFLPSQPVVRNYVQQGAIGVVFNVSSGLNR